MHWQTGMPACPQPGMQVPSNLRLTSRVTDGDGKLNSPGVSVEDLLGQRLKVGVARVSDQELQVCRQQQPLQPDVYQSRAQ